MLTMKNKEEFYIAWYFIVEHPKFMDDGENQTFPYGLDIEVVKVNPETMSIDDDRSKNTKVQIWLEHGPYEYIKSMMSNTPTHDIDLDCGADTFEEAIIEMAKLVKKKYGDYEPQEEDA